VATLLLGLGLNQEMLPAFANNYDRELAKNGLWSFVAAFRANRLDYDRFYPTLPVDAAFARVRQELARDGSKLMGADPHDLLRAIPARERGPERRLNVIQITVESLSAEFLGAFNRASHLTPNLDDLATHSLVFTNFYATGTRTDRGMEALTLSVPPTPGRSLVKRPNNEGLFTLGSVFRGKGYTTSFLYGGFGYFDNMNYFFGENGYRVLDRTKVAGTDITFANVWGACDEDLFRWTLREADRDHAAGQPFFHFVMTTSNHRPYTFPEGRIDLPSKISGRAGAVKYTDYAIGAFLRAAAGKPWFRDTLFVIVADHCASSAGKTELPVQNYRIPLLVYAPGGQIAPGTIATLTSQVDYAPTLLGLLNWSYPSRFYGRDVLAAGAAAAPRAWLGNYQKLARFDGRHLTVLKPLRQSAELDYNPVSHGLTPRVPDAESTDDTIAAYQTASWLFQHGRQREYTAPHGPRTVAAVAP
jgi:phosphoglycerol transferase MdoB-like AlkP superfamily enzyme